MHHEARTIDEAAAIIGLPAARVRAVVDHERDRPELVGYRIDTIPTERARSLPDREMEGAPT